jgi:hypothetical protein
VRAKTRLPLRLNCEDQTSDGEYENYDDANGGAEQELELKMLRTEERLEPRTESRYGRKP